VKILHKAVDRNITMVIITSVNKAPESSHRAADLALYIMAAIAVTAVFVLIAIEHLKGCPL